MTTNLFRFVAVRPPRVAASEVDRRLENREAGETFVVDVERRMKEHNESLPVARRRVGADVVGSGEYFTRHDAWQQLRPSGGALVMLMQETAHEADWQHVRQRAEEVILAVFPAEDLPDWLRSATYTRLVTTLWRSYYANALVNELRPHDRPEMLGWVRVFALLEVFRDEDRSAKLNDDEKRGRDEWLAALARWLLRARLHMPVRLFQEPIPVDAEREELPDPSEVRIAQLRTAIERAERAHAQLEDIYRLKLTRLRRRRVPAEPATDERGEGPAPREGQPAAVADERRADGTGGGLERADAPWWMAETDLSGRGELRAELARLRLPGDGSLVTEVASRLNAAMARDIGELQSLLSEQDVLGFGRTLAVIGRTRRVLTGAPTTPAAAAEPGAQSETERPR